MSDFDDPFLADDPGAGLDDPGQAPDDPAAEADHAGHPADAQEPEVSLGAGTCSHCGGSGRTTWPSSGSVEMCWYCSGSGVAS